jgi:hypothetical protein
MSETTQDREQYKVITNEKAFFKKAKDAIDVPLAELENIVFMNKSTNEYHARTGQWPGHVGAVATAIKKVREIIKSIDPGSKNRSMIVLGRIYEAFNE